ncbi:putative monooxygenase [Tuber borchii]|uniref:Putative monooxygenase n=1 Tax=Tuber borchii TaxID=42251 RepID=A0A2T6ZL94_TUBBO|nr:putative monooxygenase [Tuber borchii]
METCDIIIIGAGPTGSVLSAILSRSTPRTITLERDTQITTDPRGIALDEDGIRLLQGVGLYKETFAEIGEGMGYFNFIPGKNDLSVPPFLRFNLATIEGGTGHVGFLCHKQPVLEGCLRRVVEQSDKSEIRGGCRLAGIDEIADGVIATYVRDGREHKLKGKFLVGADGKTGFTRKMYLEVKGVKLESSDKFRYNAVWVALNWHILLPTPETHPDFPLWKLGFTPQEVYDAFFPVHFRFICNPDRPSVCGRFGLSKDRLWRFEFIVKEGEDGVKMAEWKNVWKIVGPYLKHGGKRYGLDGDVCFPQDCIKVLRSRPFSFAARSCNKWSVGRVILCGDAAHVFPPFGGQGIASGFRDASSLAWRLNLACRSASTFNHETLFEGWYSERKQQLEKSLAATIQNGNLCNEPSKIKAFIRNTYFSLIRLWPAWAHQLELGPRAEGMVRYSWTKGMPFLPLLGGGGCIPQVWSAPLAEGAGKGDIFTDDAIFRMGKKGLFQVVVLLDSIDDVEDAMMGLAGLDEASSGEVLAEEATFIIHDTSLSDPAARHTIPRDMARNEGIVRIVSAEEAKVCNDSEKVPTWPEPLYYNCYRLQEEYAGKRYLIVRPDRFAFAACEGRDELMEAAGMIGKVLRDE